ncbi:MAG: transglycosylase SLT domain-containing protein, partial [Alphaproteobacteria bacterium]|nr:transglycosylase SLT domain-containing protein [Alphaproteobacteria bacterium]
WVRAVMRQESGGHQYLNGRLTTSSAGAMGLMQVMPATYEGLRQRYGLGGDPYNPHDNIMAGTAYIREMYDRFGAPNFLAAYNAGPNRVDDYLAGGGPLPAETENYLASVAPQLGGSSAGPAPAVELAEAEAPAPAPVQPVARASLPAPAPAVVASVSVPEPPAEAAVAPGPIPAATPLAVLAAVPAAPAVAGACNPDAAYDPQAPCRSPALPPASYASYTPPTQPAAAPVSPLPVPGVQLAAATARDAPFAGAGLWSVQVGAFHTPGQARAVAEAARLVAPELLSGARVEVPATTPFGNAVLYRARLVGVSSASAAQACVRLGGRQLPCMVVPPGQGS